MAVLERIVRKEFKYWGALDIHGLFEQLGVRYTHELVLGNHPVVQLLDPDSQTAHFEEHATVAERTKNESALDVMVRGSVRRPSLYVAEIGDEFGYGLFAGQDIPQGTFIGEYSGVLTWKGIMPVQVTAGFVRGEPQTPYDMDYLMTRYDAAVNPSAPERKIGLTHVPEPSRLRIDASKAGGVTRFINHLGSERFYRPDGSVIRGPNVEVVQGCAQGYFRKWLFAAHDIQRGEELRIDYGSAYWQRATPVSRLFFVGKERLVELQKA